MVNKFSSAESNVFINRLAFSFCCYSNGIFFALNMYVVNMFLLKDQLSRFVVILMENFVFISVHPTDKKR